MSCLGNKKVNNIRCSAKSKSICVQYAAIQTSKDGRRPTKWAQILSKEVQTTTIDPVNILVPYLDYILLGYVEEYCVIFVHLAKYSSLSAKEKKNGD